MAHNGVFSGDFLRYFAARVCDIFLTRKKCATIFNKLHTSTKNAKFTQKRPAMPFW